MTATLTAARAAAKATAEELEAIQHKLATARACHSESVASLASVLAADAAGEAMAVPVDVATLRADGELKANRVAALVAAEESAGQAARVASHKLRAESLKASTSALSTSAADGLVDAARVEVEAVLRRLAGRLEKGAEGNLRALEEARQLDAEGGLRVNGLSLSGAVGEQTLVIDGSRFVGYVGTVGHLDRVGRDALTTIKDELLAPARAALAAKEAEKTRRHDAYMADMRAMEERNTKRIDLTGR